MSNTHLTEIEHSDGWTFARCSCGWSEGPFPGMTEAVDAITDHAAATREARPEIVVLCGSTRFRDAFDDSSCRLGLEGKIILQPVGHGNPTPGEKRRLDALHKRKIDLADRVFVLNVGGYIGESTRGEIEYATDLGRPIDYLEAAGCSAGSSQEADQ